LLQSSVILRPVADAVLRFHGVFFGCSLKLIMSLLVRNPSSCNNANNVHKLIIP
jgi:hypothetical protein